MESVEVSSVPDGNTTGSLYDPRDVDSRVKKLWVNNKRQIDIQIQVSKLIKDKEQIEIALDAI